MASQRVKRLSRVVVRGLWTAQQSTRPQPAPRGRRTHRVRALGDCRGNGIGRGLSGDAEIVETRRALKRGPKVDVRDAPNAAVTECAPADSRACRRVRTPRRDRPSPVSPHPNRAARPRPTGRRTSGNCRCQIRLSRAFAPRKAHPSTRERIDRTRLCPRVSPRRRWRSSGRTRTGGTRGFRGTRGAGWS